MLVREVGAASLLEKYCGKMESSSDEARIAIDGILPDGFHLLTFSL